MSNIDIASWLNKGHAEKLVNTAQSYWDNSKTWVMWAINQKDETQSEQPILGLLAWERLTERLVNEDGELFRKRVQHALVNTVDAGEIASIADIFERLGIEVLRVIERIDGRDWDIISIDFTSHTMAQYSEILPELIQLYGRACRRYEFATHNVADSSYHIGCLDAQRDVQAIDLLALHLTASNTVELHPSYGFLSKESNISIAVA